MMRQSTSRNHRSRGWKVKHVLQVCLLVAVCVWLVYQVKHSHDKKKALEEGTLKVSDSVGESRPDFLKLGRKDPQVSTVVTAADNVAHNDEEENNDEPDEAADQENKQEQNEEDDVKRGGDDEIDESDQERGDDDAEGGDEFGDEEDKEGQSGNANLLENGDHEDDEGRAQDAREKHYKEDDASSAMVRDTQEIAHENGGGVGGSMKEAQKDNVEKDELGIGRSNGTEVVSKDDEMHDFSTNVVDQPNNTLSLNGTALSEREPEVESHPNSTVLLESADHVEEHNITASNSGDQLEHHDNATLISEPQSQNEQQANSTEQSEAHNISIHNNAETGGTTPENGTSNLESVEDQSRQNETDTSAEEISVAENTLLKQNQKSNVTEGVEESDENHSTSSTTNEDGDASQGEASDSSSDLSTVTEEDGEAQTDLFTLPDIQIESRKEEDIAAE